MITDNYNLIMHLLKNKAAHFTKMVHDGKAYYIASNRAARRYVASNTFQTFAKNHSLSIDLEDFTVN